MARSVSDTLLRCGYCKRLKPAAHRVQADALEIEAAARRMFANEYDGHKTVRKMPKLVIPIIPKAEKVPGWHDAEIPSSSLHDAHSVRDALSAFAF